MTLLNDLSEHVMVAQKLREQAHEIECISDMLKNSLVKKRNTLFIAGNGGSAADAQHFAAELTGRFEKNREPLKAVALTTDTSAITAIANDFGYEFVFSRQLCALAKAGDVLLSISTSGNSQNIIECMRTAKELGVTTVMLTGALTGLAHQYADYSINVPSERTANIQEMHIFLIHYFCKVIEQDYTK